MGMNLETAIIIDLIQNHTMLHNEIVNGVLKGVRDRKVAKSRLEDFFQITRIQLMEKISGHSEKWALDLLMYALGHLNGETNWGHVVDSLELR